MFSRGTSMMSLSLRLNSSFVLTDVEIGFLSFVNILFSTFGTLGNTFVCFVFVAYPRLRCTINKFIFSLACSDLLVCLVGQPMFVVSLVKNYQQKSVLNAFEHARKTLTWVSLLASAGNLLGVTQDRYVAIVHPLRSGANRQKVAAFFVTIVWVFAICVGIGTEFSPVMKMVGQGYVFVVVMCLILPFYCRILSVARRHKRDILAQTVEFTSVGDHAMLPSRRGEREAHADTNRKSVKTVGLICVVFIVGWFPLLVLPFLYRSNFRNRNIMFSLFQWVNTLALCSSAVNPIVYSWTDRKFRKALKMVYARWVAKRLVLSQLSSENCS